MHISNSGLSTLEMVKKCVFLHERAKMSAVFALKAGAFVTNLAQEINVAGSKDKFNFWRDVLMAAKQYRRMSMYVNVFLDFFYFFHMIRLDNMFLYNGIAVRRSWEICFLCILDIYLSPIIVSISLSIKSLGKAYFQLLIFCCFVKLIIGPSPIKGFILHKIDKHSELSYDSPSASFNRWIVFRPSWLAGV